MSLLSSVIFGAVIGAILAIPLVGLLTVYLQNEYDEPLH